MAWQGLKLNLRVSQKQILTPGLVQMVSVLALNRLELREMINQEMIANPVLEEQSEEPTQTDNYSDETFLKAETEKVPEKPEANPFDEFDVGTFFNQYLDTGGDGGKSQEREVSERPSFEKFLSSPTGLTEHLQWQLSVTICSDAVKEIADSIIGNLDENGYLTASTEELMQNGKYSQDDLDDALAVVQDFDPIGVGARDLRECLLRQLKAFDPQNTLAHQIVSEHLKQVQSNQLKMLGNDLMGQRILRIKCFQLPQQAFTQIPRAHSDRVEVLHHGQRVIQVILRILSVLHQLFGGSRQIAVLVQIANDAIRDFFYRVRTDGNAQLPLEMLGQPGRRREELFEGGPFGNFALLRFPAVSAGIQVLVEESSHVKLVKRIGFGLLRNFFGLRFQEGLVAVVVRLGGFFALLFQDRIGDHLLVDHFAQLEAVQR